MASGYPLTKTFPESSAIERAAYNPGTESLDIWYSGGNQYSYYGVPPAAFRELLDASSAGEFVNRQIKPRYPFRKRSRRSFRR